MKFTTARILSDVRAMDVLCFFRFFHMAFDLSHAVAEYERIEEYQERARLR